MYQKLLIAAMSLTIGVCATTQYSQYMNTATGCWGLLYPRLCYIEGTYKSLEGTAAMTDPTELLQISDPDQIMIRWKLLEILSE